MIIWLIQLGPDKTFVQLFVCCGVALSNSYIEESQKCDCFYKNNSTIFDKTESNYRR